MNSSRRESLEEPHLASTGGDVGGSTAVKATVSLFGDCADSDLIHHER